MISFANVAALFTRNDILFYFPLDKVALTASITVARGGVG
jgi:hypothetical protein